MSISLSERFLSFAFFLFSVFSVDLCVALLGDRQRPNELYFDSNIGFAYVKCFIFLSISCLLSFSPARHNCTVFKEVFVRKKKKKRRNCRLSHSQICLFLTLCMREIEVSEFSLFSFYFMLFILFLCFFRSHNPEMRAPKISNNPKFGANIIISWNPNWKQSQNLINKQFSIENERRLTNEGEKAELACWLWLIYLKLRYCVYFLCAVASQLHRNFSIKWNQIIF